MELSPNTKNAKNGYPPPGIMLRIHGLRQRHQGPAQTGHHEVVLVLRGGIGFQQRQQLVLAERRRLERSVEGCHGFGDFKQETWCKHGDVMELYDIMYIYIYHYYYDYYYYIYIQSVAPHGFLQFCQKFGITSVKVR